MKNRTNVAGRAGRPLSKETVFVAAHPHVQPKEIVARALVEGIALDAKRVANIRWRLSRLQSKYPNLGKSLAPSPAEPSSERLRRLILELGLNETRAVLARVERLERASNAA
jgi:hypothetical protein